jgi:D-3-phosphoglycerate dehydrogenase
MERNGGCRIIVANKNIPNMVSQISALLATEGFNIANMLNRNKAEIAYNIIDIDRKHADPAIADKIAAINGVIMVRIIQ